MLITLSNDRFPQVYALMQQSFPETEYRPRRAQEALLQRQEYSLWGLTDAGGMLLGFIALYDFSDFLFAEHLAVDPRYRNMGLGKTILQAVRAWGRPLVLEVEPPETDLARRRIGFYTRNGLTLTHRPYTQPPMAPGLPAIPLLLMSTLGELDESRFEAIRKILHIRVYGSGPNDYR